MFFGTNLKLNYLKYTFFHLHYTHKSVGFICTNLFRIICLKLKLSNLLHNAIFPPSVSGIPPDGDRYIPYSANGKGNRRLAPPAGPPGTPKSDFEII